jgi:hypothetical protein
MPRLDLICSLHSTRAIVVSLKRIANRPIKFIKPSVGVVNWHSMGFGGGFHADSTAESELNFIGVSDI